MRGSGESCVKAAARGVVSPVVALEDQARSPAGPLRGGLTACAMECGEKQGNKVGAGPTVPRPASAEATPLQVKLMLESQQMRTRAGCQITKKKEKNAADAQERGAALVRGSGESCVKAAAHGVVSPAVPLEDRARSPAGPVRGGLTASGMECGEKQGNEVGGGPTGLCSASVEATLLQVKLRWEAQRVRTRAGCQITKKKEKTQLMPKSKERPWCEAQERAASRRRCVVWSARLLPGRTERARRPTHHEGD